MQKLPPQAKTQQILEALQAIATEANALPAKPTETADSPLEEKEKEKEEKTPSEASPAPAEGAAAEGLKAKSEAFEHTRVETSAGQAPAQAWPGRMGRKAVADPESIRPHC